MFCEAFFSKNATVTWSYYQVQSRQAMPKRKEERTIQTKSTGYVAELILSPSNSGIPLGSGGQVLNSPLFVRRAPLGGIAEDRRGEV